MAATYVFSTDLYVGANSEAEARDGLMELLAELVGRNNSETFDLVEMIYEEDEA